MGLAAGENMSADLDGILLYVGIHCSRYISRYIHSCYSLYSILPTYIDTIER